MGFSVAVGAVFTFLEIFQEKFEGFYVHLLGSE